MKLEKDIADSRSCGQEFPTKWGGHEATYQSIVMDIGYHGHDNSHAAWLVEADRPKDRDDIPKRERPSSQDDPMSMDSMERVASLQESTCRAHYIARQREMEANLAANSTDPDDTNFKFTSDN